MARGTTTSPSASTSAELAAASGTRPRPACVGRYRCDGDGVVDEDDCDGGGGGEGVGVEDPGAGRGAVDEQRELLAELFRVGGAGFAGGVGEPRGDGFLVVACVLGCGVLGVVEFDGGGDVGAQGGGGGDVEGGEEPFAGREVGAG